MAAETMSSDPYIVVLVSSYREGWLLVDAVRSAVKAADVVLVLEGPVAGRPVGIDAELDAHAELYVRGTPGVAFRRGDGWGSDAAKRNELLDWAKAEHHRLPEHEREARPLWCLWLDGDEVLNHGEYLRAYCHRAEAETSAGGFPLRIVELDGSVAKAYCRVFRADRVDRLLVGAHLMELHEGGMVVSLPNVPVCAAGGIPVGYGEGGGVTVEELADKRPPVIGEPHILHRAILRTPERAALGRLHDDEAEAYARLAELRELPGGEA